MPGVLGFNYSFGAASRTTVATFFEKLAAAVACVPFHGDDSVEANAF
jgi:hypothetical protein